MTLHFPVVLLARQPLAWGDVCWRLSGAVLLQR